MNKIFIVEDDQKITFLLAVALKKAEFNVEATSDFQNIMTEINNSQPDLILMDLNLPYFNGYYWTTLIRKKQTTPIIFISSQNDQLTQVRAMELGADDFIEKPFNLEILLAKIKALLRRTTNFNKITEIISFLDYQLNLKNGTVTLKGQVVDLSKTELQILHLLFTHQNQVVSKGKLINKLWENEAFVDQNTLMVNISRLRKKLSAINLDQHLLTRKGQGYLLSINGKF